MDPSEPDSDDPPSGWFDSILDFVNNALGGIFESLAVPFEGIANGLNSIRNGITNLYNSVSSIISYLNPFHENFFIKVAFVPSEGYFQTYFDDILEVFEMKIPIIAELFSFFQSIANIVFQNTIPEFEITVPVKWGGQTYTVVDFSYFTEYRTYIINFIRFSSWFFFLKRIYRRLPDVIY